MPTFLGVNHVTLSVRDLEVSTRFYTEVLGFLPVLDFGVGRVCLDPGSGFAIGLTQHPDGSPERFSELRTGLDHLGFDAADRRELEEWVQRFEAMGVEYTPIEEQPLGHHLNFRDPDGIALEFHAPTGVFRDALADWRSREVTAAEVLAVLESIVEPG